MLKQFIIRGYPKEPVAAGTTVRLKALLDGATEPLAQETIAWTIVGPRSTDVHAPTTVGPLLDFTPPTPGAYSVTASRTLPTATSQAGLLPKATSVDAVQRNAVTDPWDITVHGAGVVSSEGTVPVSLQRTAVSGTSDQVLWTVIRNRTNAIAFRNYKRFIDGVMLRSVDVRYRGLNKPALNFTGTQAYQVLKQATDAFLMQECGVVDENDLAVRPAGLLDPRLVEAELETGSPEAREFLEQEPRRYSRSSPLSVEELHALRGQYYEQLGQEGAVELPYLRIIRERLGDIPLKGPNETAENCYGILRSRLTGPLAIELIWSYWHEEGMLAQTLNAILARFQNRRLVAGPDPLARLDLDPLRPLANLFWGWAEDELHRLTVRRRAFEYDHEYGLTLLGRALPRRRTVESRSRFLESFHTLLHSCAHFFKEDDDTTVIADGFPLLNALRETHLILAEGAHNQFGDLPSTARAEMLIMEWLLARPEMRDFLGGRVMVPYEEDWMDRVDTMKQLQGWSDTSITHARDLGVFGEQLLLSIRYGNWSVINDPQQAANWARYWRPEIQRYTHAYRAATGVDLVEQVDATVPAYLLQRRLAGQQRVAR